MIKDITLTPLKIIDVPDGNVMHALRKNDLEFSGFGEAYFSEIQPNRVKAWKRHRRMTLNLIVPNGEIRFILFDDRPNSESQFQEVKLSKKNYYRLTVPPMIWVGFQGLSMEESILLNIADIMHDPSEVDNKSVEEINFNWEIEKK